MIALIETKRKFLLDTVQELKDIRKDELEAALKTLQQVNESAIKLQDECKDIATKPDISTEFRLHQMNRCVDRQREMEQNIDLNFGEIDTTNIKLQVEYDEDAFDSNFESILNIRFGEEVLQLRYDGIEPAKILKFSSDLMSPNGLQLGDNHKSVKNIERSHSYIVVDTEPVTSGVQCWRVKVEGSIFH